MASPKHSPAHQALGRTVRFLRAKVGLSQEELGFRARLHRNYVGAIERGEINPTFAVLLKVSRGLRLPLSEIVGEWEELRRELPGALPLPLADGRVQALEAGVHLSTQTAELGQDLPLE